MLGGYLGACVLKKPIQRDKDRADIWREAKMSPLSQELRPRGLSLPASAPIPNSLSPSVPQFYSSKCPEASNAPLHSSSGITSIAFSKEPENPTMKQIKPMPLLLHILLS